MAKSMRILDAEVADATNSVITVPCSQRGDFIFLRTRRQPRMCTGPASDQTLTSKFEITTTAEEEN